ncbi:22402_t:CDS:2, partial [Entrophospora sp. SA101]
IKDFIQDENIKMPLQPDEIFNLKIDDVEVDDVEEVGDVEEVDDVEEMDEGKEVDDEEEVEEEEENHREVIVVASQMQIEDRAVYQEQESNGHVPESLITLLYHKITLVRLAYMLKEQPDGVERGLVGEIIKRFEIKGYKLIALQLLKPTEELIKEHYADLREKPFFPGLLQYILSGPVVGMVWEGKDAVKTGRRMLGETDPLKSAPGTIRGDYCIEVGRNMCHGSDSVENAEKEIALWFPNGVTQWNRNKVHSLFYEN